eukprot:TRINITY_DN3030_c0_g2_i1.p1 TRINITY_DN3030_c0_g2~~TRINITY_DN3030_c0_g2_i1.p1  ORF type:complete len:275 (-),score=103.61 TRINITY_DN3030_c0_g2_i1:47-871(-)
MSSDFLEDVSIEVLDDDNNNMDDDDGIDEEINDIALDIEIDDVDVQTSSHSCCFGIFAPLYYRVYHPIPKKIRTLIYTTASCLIPIVVFAVLIAFVLIPVLTNEYLDDGDENIEKGNKLLGNNGAVSSHVSECSELGTKILTLGGNAVDAAVGTCICVGIFSPCSSGIGGGGVSIIKLVKEDEIIVLDFRERAPEFSTQTMFQDDPRLSTFGGLSIGIPGEIRGLFEMKEKYGDSDITWKEIIEMNIPYAEKTLVSKEMELAIKDAEDNIMPGM